MILSLKSGLLVFLILSVEFAIFVMFGEHMGRIFDLIYGSIWALIPYSILSLLFYICLLVIFHSVMLRNVANLTQFFVISMSVPMVVQLPFWLAWFRSPSDAGVSYSWIFATIILAASSFIPFGVGAIAFHSRLKETKKT